MKPAAKDTTQTIADPWLVELLVRLAMFLVLGGSVWLIWWSVDRLTLVNRQLNQKSSAVAAIADEVQILDRKLDPIQFARTEERFKAANQAIFAGPDECAGWSKEIPEQALNLGLEATLQPGQVQPHVRADFKLSLLSNTIDLHPAVGSQWTNFPYQRLLDFTGVLQKPGRRIDLLELVVIGGSNSVRQAKAVVQLWSQEGKPSP